MALIADSGGIYGLYDASEKKHKAIRAAFDAEPGLAIIPMPVLSEIDYLLRTRLGIQAELDFIDDIRAGAFTLEPCLPEDLARCAALIEAYRDLELGLADSWQAAGSASGRRLKFTDVPPTTLSTPDGIAAAVPSPSP